MRIIKGRRYYDDATEAQDASARFCYIANENCERDANGIIPSAVYEYTPGHYPMRGNGSHATRWYFGKSESLATAVAARINARIGLSPADVQQIVSSSIEASVVLR